MVRNVAWPVLTWHWSSLACELDGKASMDGIQKALGMLLRVLQSVLHELTMTIDAMEQMSSDINKIRRSL